MRTASCLVPLVIWMWLAMLLVHEVGHVIGAWLTGGRIVYVNIYPGQLPSTLVQPNPRPGVVLWSGFLTGWLVPLAIVYGRDSLRELKATRGASRDTSLLSAALRCWAGFCLLAGGVYLAAGGTERLTDTGQLVSVGWPLPWLIAIGVSVAVVGYVWSSQAWPRLLAGVRRRSPTAAQVATCWLLLATWILGQWLVASAPTP